MTRIAASLIAASLIATARDALAAEPVGEGPTDEAPEKEAPIWYNSDMASSWQAGRQDGWGEAIARWGHPAAPINADAPVILIDDILTIIDGCLFKIDEFVFGEEYTSSGNNEWATELAIQCILERKTPADIANHIASEWQPSDDEMIENNSCGTAWHDGCR
jgi:hypothetical protein